MRRIGILAALVIAACNANLSGQRAPAIEGGDWVGGAAPTGQWKVLSFFDPL